MAKKRKPVSEQAKIENFNFDYVDLIVSSNKLKKTFLKRCEELKYDPFILCRKHNVPIAEFRKRYLEDPQPRCTKLFDQQMLLKLFKAVGLEVKIVLVQENISRKS